jgi:uncharacterized protein YggE
MTSGSGDIRLTPDRAVVRVGVTTIRARAAEASMTMATIVRAVMDSLVALGLARDSILTSGLGVGPAYDRDGRPTSNYMATIAIDAAVRDFSRLGRVVDALLAAGATTIDRITFESDSTQAGKVRALAAAFADARTQAEALAAASGNRLDRLIQVSTQPGDVAVYPGVQAVSQVLRVPMTPQDVHVHASVYAKWALRAAQR